MEPYICQDDIDSLGGGSGVGRGDPRMPLRVSGNLFLYELIFMVLLTFIRDLGLDLQTTEIFLLNDLGSELSLCTVSSQPPVQSE